jgi:hypothetical protein
MAINSKNKYPADKTGTKYSEFKNTKRVSPGKVHTEKDAKQSGSSANQSAGKTS